MMKGGSKNRDLAAYHKQSDAKRILAPGVGEWSKSLQLFIHLNNSVPRGSRIPKIPPREQCGSLRQSRVLTGFEGDR